MINDLCCSFKIVGSKGIRVGVIWFRTQAHGCIFAGQVCRVWVIMSGWKSSMRENYWGPSTLWCLKWWSRSWGSMSWTFGWLHLDYGWSRCLCTWTWLQKNLLHLGQQIFKSKDIATVWLKLHLHSDYYYHEPLYGFKFEAQPVVVFQQCAYAWTYSIHSRPLFYSSASDTTVTSWTYSIQKHSMLTLAIQMNTSISTAQDYTDVSKEFQF